MTIEELKLDTFVVQVTDEGEMYSEWCDIEEEGPGWITDISEDTVTIAWPYGMSSQEETYPIKHVLSYAFAVAPERLSHPDDSDDEHF